MIAELNIPHPMVSLAYSPTERTLFVHDAVTRWHFTSVDGKHQDVLIVRLTDTREAEVEDLCHLLCAQLGVDAIAVSIPQLGVGRWAGPKANDWTFDPAAFIPYVVAQAQHH